MNISIAARSKISKDLDTIISAVRTTSGYDIQRVYTHVSCTDSTVNAKTMFKVSASGGKKMIPFMFGYNVAEDGSLKRREALRPCAGRLAHDAAVAIGEYGRSITASEDDEFEDENSFVEDLEDPDSIQDTLGDIAEQVDDALDTMEDEYPDDPSIEVNNNIDGHYIVECDKCHGIFISALVESDQPVKSVSGTCPICDSETDQTVKWVIHAVNDHLIEDPTDIPPDKMT